ncbi:hypothetical protein HOI71_05380, partial [Candidatus Poribacteria bacterium]|nr:hypothetical protein [Candidatus Poribacteria bacterium]
MRTPTNTGSRSSRVAIGVSLALHVVGAIVVGVYVATTVVAERLPDDLPI